jgi:hypothetical protein
MSSISAVSATVRVMGPTTSTVSNGSPSDQIGMRPREHLRPTVPQNDDGTRMDPPPSLPVASGVMRAASAAAEPPLEPPTVRVGSHGLFVMPVRGLSVMECMPNSGVVVLPSRIAPAAFKRCQIRPSSSGTWSAKWREPKVVRTPAVGVRSLTAIGMPCRAGSSLGSMRRSASPASRAAASACSWQTVTNAFTMGSAASICRRNASTTSTGDTSRRRIIPASSTPVASVMDASPLIVLLQGLICNALYNRIAQSGTGRQKGSRDE